MNEFSNSFLYCNWILMTGPHTMHYARTLVFSDMIQYKWCRLHNSVLVYSTVAIGLPNKHENHRTFVLLITITRSFRNISSEISVCYIQDYRKLCGSVQEGCCTVPEVGSPTHKSLKFVHAMFVMYSPNPLKLRTLSAVLKLCRTSDRRVGNFRLPCIF
jgi:hypothetical protein